MDWNEIDSQLEEIRKDRRWLSDVTPYSLSSIRDALGPSSKKRSARMLSVLRRAIDDEAAKQNKGIEKAPGLFEIFPSPESLDRADRASRIVNAPSLVQFCRDAIEDAAARAFEEEVSAPLLYPTPDPPALRGDEEEAGEETKPS